MFPMTMLILIFIKKYKISLFVIFLLSAEVTSSSTRIVEACLYANNSINLGVGVFIRGREQGYIKCCTFPVYLFSQFIIFSSFACVFHANSVNNTLWLYMVCFGKFKKI